MFVRAAVLVSLLAPLSTAQAESALDRHVAITTSNGNVGFFCVTGTGGSVTVVLGEPTYVEALEPGLFTQAKFLDIHVDTRPPVRVELSGTRFSAKSVQVGGEPIRSIRFDLPFEALPDKYVQRLEYDYAWGLEVVDKEIEIPPASRTACISVGAMRGKSGPLVLHESVTSDELRSLIARIRELQDRPTKSSAVLPLYQRHVANREETTLVIESVAALRKAIGAVPDDITLHTGVYGATGSYLAIVKDRSCPSGKSGLHVELTFEKANAWRVSGLSTHSYGCVDPKAKPPL